MAAMYRFLTKLEAEAVCMAIPGANDRLAGLSDMLCACTTKQTQHVM